MFGFLFFGGHFLIESVISHNSAITWINKKHKKKRAKPKTEDPKLKPLRAFFQQGNRNNDLWIIERFSGSDLTYVRCRDVVTSVWPVWCLGELGDFRMDKTTFLVESGWWDRVMNRLELKMNFIFFFLEGFNWIEKKLWCRLKLGMSSNPLGFGWIW